MSEEEDRASTQRYVESHAVGQPEFIPGFPFGVWTLHGFVIIEIFGFTKKAVHPDVAREFARVLVEQADAARGPEVG